MKNVTIPASLLSELIEYAELRRNQWNAALEAHRTGHLDTISLAVAELWEVDEHEAAGMTRITENCIQEAKDALNA